MSEPPEIAEQAELVVDGVWHWRVRNSAIGGAPSSCHQLAADGDVVIIDPLRLAPPALAELPRPTAIVLTAKCHQRSAWRYRAQFGIPVWAPSNAPAMDEQPDHTYGKGDVLPAGLTAVRTPGPEPVHYCLVRQGRPGLLFCSDLLMRDQHGVRFVDPAYHDDPAETRRSVERLLDLEFDLLCLDHGAPVSAEPRRAIADLLGRTA
jgi:glyoxylase-like metal-dependent hydrolase (beta-lactamase superfamily II)